MRRLLLPIMAVLAALLCSTAEAQCTRGYAPRPTGRVYYYRPAPAPVQWVYTQPAPAPTYQAPAPPQCTAGDEAAAFLAALNLWRSWHRLGPVGWDAALAAKAAINTRVHDGTPNQCWSASSSLMESLKWWQASPDHAAILLGATVAVGASPCPSGATCNAR